MIMKLQILNKTECGFSFRLVKITRTLRSVWRCVVTMYLRGRRMKLFKQTTNPLLRSEMTAQFLMELGQMGRCSTSLLLYYCIITTSLWLISCFCLSVEEPADWASWPEADAHGRIHPHDNLGCSLYHRSVVWGREKIYILNVVTWIIIITFDFFAMKHECQKKERTCET